MERDGVKGRIIIIKKIEVFVCVCVYIVYSLAGCYYQNPIKR